MNTLKKLLVVALVYSLISCGQVKDSAPANYSKRWDEIPDAVPVSVTPSKYGNPNSYEVFGKTYYVKASAAGFQQKGIASWYGNKFHGERTSSGEDYDMYAMTAAHKTLPLPTYVRVTNLKNQRSVVLRVNDRGPFHTDRIIDLSYTAAKDIGIVGPGTARVEIFALGTPATTDGGSSRTYVQGDYFSGNFTYQVGAYVNRENAEKQKRELEGRYKNAHITVFDRGDQIFYRVRIGKFTTLEDAVRHEEILIQDGYPDAILIAE